MSARRQRAGRAENESAANSENSSVTSSFEIARVWKLFAVLATSASYGPKIPIEPVSVVPPTRTFSSPGSNELTPGQVNSQGRQAAHGRPAGQTTTQPAARTTGQAPKQPTATTRPPMRPPEPLPPPRSPPRRSPALGVTAAAAAKLAPPPIACTTAYSIECSSFRKACSSARNSRTSGAKNPPNGPV